MEIEIGDAKEGVMPFFDGDDENVAESSTERKERINQNQFFDLITGEEVSWQSIIYDLIKTEQLDPWDIDLAILANKYLEIIRAMEEANFFVSSKVLLACALLLRLKTEILVNRDIQSIDELLYGKEDKKKYLMERIELDEDEIPILVPRTPLPRYKKVSLQELMAALNNAIETENRRIKKEIKVRQAEKSALVVMPKIDRINLKDRIAMIYAKIKLTIKKPEKVKMAFSELAPTKDEKLSAFVPILHLSNQERLYLEQEKHFEEIFMMLDRVHIEIAELREEVENIEDDEKWEELESENDAEANFGGIKRISVNASDIDAAEQ